MRCGCMPPASRSSMFRRTCPGPEHVSAPMAHPRSWRVPMGAAPSRRTPRRLRSRRAPRAPLAGDLGHPFDGISRQPDAPHLKRRMRARGVGTDGVRFGRAVAVRGLATSGRAHRLPSQPRDIPPGPIAAGCPFRRQAARLSATSNPRGSAPRRVGPTPTRHPLRARTRKAPEDHSALSRASPMWAGWRSPPGEQPSGGLHVREGRSDRGRVRPATCSTVWSGRALASRGGGEA